MNLQARLEKEMVLSEQLISNVGQLGLYLQNIERAYAIACRVFGISENALELKSFIVSSKKLKMVGLDLPLELTVQVAHHRADLFTKYKNETLDSGHGNSLTFETLFESIAKGAEKIDDKSLSAHVLSSLKYQLDKL